MLGAKKYYMQLRLNKANFNNIMNWSSHWLYGTDPIKLAKQSKREIVYNPPTCKGGRRF